MSEAAARLEIGIDREACAGTGACSRRAPRTFALDAGGCARVLDPAGDPPEDVLDAARRCPRFAIAVRRGGRPLGEPAALGPQPGAPRRR